MDSLQDKINEDLKKAQQQKNELELLVLRGINSALHNYKIEKKGKELSEQEVIEVLTSEAKKRKDAIEGFKKGNRQDLVEKEQKELKILEKYLPEQVSDQEIKQLAEKVIEEVNAVSPQDIGKVMGGLMPKIKGRADGNKVRKIVSELLESK